MANAYAVMDRYPDGYLDDSSIQIFGTLNDATAYADEQSNDSQGAVPVVFRIEEVPESHRWDWGVRRVGASEKPMVYVNERAARACCTSGYELLKRRLGTPTWIPGGEP